MFYGFEGTEDRQPITQGIMSTKEVALRAHVAKVHFFLLEKHGFLLLQVDRVHVFMGDFGTNGGAAFQLDLWVTSALYSDLYCFVNVSGSLETLCGVI